MVRRKSALFLLLFGYFLQSCWSHRTKNTGASFRRSSVKVKPTKPTELEVAIDDTNPQRRPKPKDDNLYIINFSSRKLRKLRKSLRKRKYSNVDLQNDPCKYDPCLHRGVCKNDLSRGPFTYLCICLVGYYGARCQNVVPICGDQPCENGECVSRDDGSLCRCSENYEDYICDSAQTGRASTVYSNQSKSRTKSKRKKWKSKVVIIGVAVGLLVLCLCMVHIFRFWSRRRDLMYFHKQSFKEGVPEEPPPPGCIAICGQVCCCGKKKKTDYTETPEEKKEKEKLAKKEKKLAKKEKKLAKEKKKNAKNPKKKKKKKTKPKVNHLIDKRVPKNRKPPKTNTKKSVRGMTKTHVSGGSGFNASPTTVKNTQPPPPLFGTSVTYNEVGNIKPPPHDQSDVSYVTDRKIMSQSSSSKKLVSTHEKSLQPVKSDGFTETEISDMAAKKSSSNVSVTTDVSIKVVTLTPPPYASSPPAVSEGKKPSSNESSTSAVSIRVMNITPLSHMPGTSAVSVNVGDKKQSSNDLITSAVSTKVMNIIPLSHMPGTSARTTKVEDKRSSSYDSSVAAVSIKVESEKPPSNESSTSAVSATVMNIIPLSHMPDTSAGTTKVEDKKQSSNESSASAMSIRVMNITPLSHMPGTSAGSVNVEDKKQSSNDSSTSFVSTKFMNIKPLSSTSAGTIKVEDKKQSSNDSSTSAVSATVMNLKPLSHILGMSDLSTTVGSKYSSLNESSTSAASTTGGSMNPSTNLSCTSASSEVESKKSSSNASSTSTVSTQVGSNRSSPLKLSRTSSAGFTGMSEAECRNQLPVTDLPFAHGTSSEFVAISADGKNKPSSHSPDVSAEYLDMSEQGNIKSSSYTSITSVEYTEMSEMEKKGSPRRIKKKYEKTLSYEKHAGCTNKSGVGRKQKGTPTGYKEKLGVGSKTPPLFDHGTTTRYTKRFKTALSKQHGSPIAYTETHEVETEQHESSSGNTEMHEVVREKDGSPAGEVGSTHPTPYAHGRFVWIPEDATAMSSDENITHRLAEMQSKKDSSSPKWESAKLTVVSEEGGRKTRKISSYTSSTSTVSTRVGSNKYSPRASSRSVVSTKIGSKKSSPRTSSSSAVSNKVGSSKQFSSRAFEHTGMSVDSSRKPSSYGSGTSVGYSSASSGTSANNTDMSAMRSRESSNRQSSSSAKFTKMSPVRYRKSSSHQSTADEERYRDVAKVHAYLGCTEMKRKSPRSASPPIEIKRIPSPGSQSVKLSTSSSQEASEMHEDISENTLEHFYNTTPTKILPDNKIEIKAVSVVRKNNSRTSMTKIGVKTIDLTKTRQSYIGEHEPDASRGSGTTLVTPGNSISKLLDSAHNSDIPEFAFSRKPKMTETRPKKRNSDDNESGLADGIQRASSPIYPKMSSTQTRNRIKPISSEHYEDWCFSTITSTLSEGNPSPEKYQEYFDREAKKIKLQSRPEVDTSTGSQKIDRYSKSGHFVLQPPGKHHSDDDEGSAYYNITNNSRLSISTNPNENIPDQFQRYDYVASREKSIALEDQLSCYSEESEGKHNDKELKVDELCPNNLEQELEGSENQNGSNEVHVNKDEETLIDKQTCPDTHAHGNQESQPCSPQKQDRSDQLTLDDWSVPNLSITSEDHSTPEPQRPDSRTTNVLGLDHPVVEYLETSFETIPQEFTALEYPCQEDDYLNTSWAVPKSSFTLENKSFEDNNVIASSETYKSKTVNVKDMIIDLQNTLGTHCDTKGMSGEMEIKCTETNIDTASPKPSATGTNNTQIVMDISIREPKSDNLEHSDVVDDVSLTYQEEEKLDTSLIKPKSPINLGETKQLQDNNAHNSSEMCQSKNVPVKDIIIDLQNALDTTTTQCDTEDKSERMEIKCTEANTYIARRIPAARNDSQINMNTSIHESNKVEHDAAINAVSLTDKDQDICTSSIDDVDLNESVEWPDIEDIDDTREDSVNATFGSVTVEVNELSCELDDVEDPEITFKTILQQPIHSYKFTVD